MSDHDHRDDGQDGVLAALDRDALRDAVAALESSRFAATGGEGRVSATVDGSGRLVAVEIDPLLERHQRQRLAGWLTTAVLDARAAAAEQTEELVEATVGDRAAFIEAAGSAVPWLTPPRKA